jgi:hypothetical protein
MLYIAHNNNEVNNNQATQNTCSKWERNKERSFMFSIHDTFSFENLLLVKLVGLNRPFGLKANSLP